MPSKEHKLEMMLSKIKLGKPHGEKCLFLKFSADECSSCVFNLKNGESFGYFKSYVWSVDNKKQKLSPKIESMSERIYNFESKFEVIVPGDYGFRIKTAFENNQKTQERILFKAYDSYYVENIKSVS